jgi:hypothetical protein
MLSDSTNLTLASKSHKLKRKRRLMDIRDLTKHPFKIECPAILTDDSPDCWAFMFDNGYHVFVREDISQAGFWHAIVSNPPGVIVQELEWLSDDNGAITSLIDHFAHLEKP